MTLRETSMDYVDEMEREILKVVDQEGPLHSGSQSARALQAKYPDAYDDLMVSQVKQHLL